MTELLICTTVLSFLICLPLYATMLSLAQSKRKAVEQAREWEERYVELLKAYKALEWKGPTEPQQITPAAEFTEDELLDEAHHEIEAMSYGG